MKTCECAVWVVNGVERKDRERERRGEERGRDTKINLRGEVKRVVVKEVKKGRESRRGRGKER
jgi:hypothetical protein